VVLKLAPFPTRSAVPFAPLPSVSLHPVASALLAVTRHQLAFCVADPVRPVQTRWQFDSRERPKILYVNLRNLRINSDLVSSIREIRGSAFPQTVRIKLDFVREACD
jgi:hypothetical protein